MKTGNQSPTFSVIGDYAYSLGSDVIEMFEEEGGATFYPSQKRELELMLARNADGSPSALTIGISKPRQNGKSYAARFYAVYMSVFEHRQVLYSAHHSTTTNIRDYDIEQLAAIVKLKVGLEVESLSTEVEATCWNIDILRSDKLTE